jgi:NAD(P)-dependent dehydrogenase (short-subunit alcohol dehydrogenase family)
MFDFKGKVIVITGGSMGLGLALADRFRASGATVVVLSRKAEENGKDVFRCDVSDPKDVEQCFGKIAAAQGKIDILINNAGFGQSGALEFLSPDSLRYISDTNFLGVVYCTKYALPLMKKGRILNISSMSAFVPMPFRTMYSATKSAVNGFTMGMVMELQGTGIDIASVCLGDIRTGFASRREVLPATNARYGDRIAAVDRFVDARGMEKKIPLENAVNKILRIAFRKNLYPLYIVGTKYRLAYGLSRILPVRILINLVMKGMQE